ncbi:tail fiber domain-containing protein [Dyadobacter aurulentus]|uniref:tail fiber domain-containing protein n=1 Tax=Dyadobacter sp. UC 10 TaxID=2605428 RepID=UPI0011F21949|nr:tail fiber domain-containing protein [Dyadobacter sp. UC 10]KAA0992361.1 hypothetical protein FXO21_20330 [Dyadobacter sp. UC 10]
MKLPLFFLLAMLLALCSAAQVPQRFAFQGAARDAAGKAIVNRNVSLRLTIRPTTALGAPVYQETHVTQTSATGIFNISVGAGLVQSGDFGSIKWDSDKFFLQTELDPDGGGNYVNLGATQLLSVPYALHAAEAGRWKNFDPVIQEGSLLLGKSLPELEWGPGIHRLLWYPKRAALRFGAWSDENVWTDANIGHFSFAGGFNAMAAPDGFAFGFRVKSTGENGIAMGAYTEAARRSVAFGYGVNALANNSIAIGTANQSLNAHSATFGYNLESRVKYGIAMGMSNDISDVVTDEILPTQRLFQIGNGDQKHDGPRSNALTILYNGNVGIGNNVLQPTHILDVGHRMRLRSNPGYTAGLWLDDNGGAQYCFIGGYDNDQAGFYFENFGWKFTVNKNGNAFLTGALTQNSDLRLKRDIRPLTPSFEKLTSISGRQYYWKDPQRSQGLQTGLIAQEVEAVFPELVETGKDGYKSVNYIGLIPHLLEAVKELKQENRKLSSENERLSSSAGEVMELRKRLEAIEASLAKSSAISVK